MIVNYSEDGHVKDDDAKKIDFAELLQEMKADNAESNEARVAAGFPRLDLVGWAEPPHYDGATKKLYWAKELASQGAEEHTLNYAIRALGRRGVLELNAVAGVSQLQEIKQEMQAVLGFVEFNKGQRYADFNPSLDKVAAYGIGALIAGKLVAKAGLLKVILAFLLASKKFVIVGLVALGAAIKKLLGWRKQAATRIEDGAPVPSDQV